MQFQEKLFRAARTILTHCLALTPGAQYLLFTDEKTRDIAMILANVGLELDLNPIVLYYDMDMQKTLQDAPIPPALQSLMHDCQAACTCLNSDPVNFLFRDQIRRSAWNAGLRVAHMPGINERILSFADLDYSQLSYQCELFALALAKGARVDIITRDRDGKEYTLTAPLKAWDRYPIISDGIIGPGVWGNVPSGETYIAPPEGMAHGDIVINGSIHQFLIPEDQDLRLHFEHGRLMEWFPKEGPAAHYLQHEIIGLAEMGGDRNWSNLAEIGLGANPRIRKLTGNPLLDEKKYGSIHIALGDNIDMGGTVESKIHCDMVCLSAEVQVDGKMIISNNRVSLKESEWREDYRSLTVPDWWTNNLHLRSTAVDVDIKQGYLKRFWNTSTCRVCSVFVGDERSSMLAANVYQALRKSSHRYTIPELALQFHQMDEEAMQSITYLMYLYGLVSPDRNGAG